MRRTFSEALMLRAAILAAGGSLKISATDFYEAERLMQMGEPMRVGQADRPPQLELKFKDNLKREREAGRALDRAMDYPDEARAERARLATEAPLPVAAPPTPVPTPEEGGWRYPVQRIQAGHRSTTSHFIDLAACLEALGGYLLVDPRFMGTLRPGDHIDRRVVADGSLELRLVHVPQEYDDEMPAQPALRAPNPKGLL